MISQKKKNILPWIYERSRYEALKYAFIFQLLSFLKLWSFEFPHYWSPPLTSSHFPLPTLSILTANHWHKPAGKR